MDLVMDKSCNRNAMTHSLSEFGLLAHQHLSNYTEDISNFDKNVTVSLYNSS